MFLGHHQIIRKMNELCEKIDLNKVAFSGDTQSKVRGLVCQLLTSIIFMFDL